MGRNFKSKTKKRLNQGGIKKYKAEKELQQTHDRGRQDDTNVSAGERLLRQADDLEAKQRKEKADVVAAKQAAMLRARAKRAAEEEARRKAEEAEGKGGAGDAAGHL